MGARSLPAVIAHRGSSLRAPENTLAAFRRAVAEGPGSSSSTAASPATGSSS